MTTMTLDTMFSPARPAARAATKRRSSVRLTRRGRIVVVVAALVVAFAIGVFVTAAGSVATQSPGTPEPTRIVQVHSGDTLWGIASEVAADGDVRAMMEQIERLNALESSTLRAGQRLVVPAG
ncbi:MAG TPA: LysM peptidoglycan-binding domain-containing protein [Nocardioides sp.]|uniref:LysM peptidoglycan-binding domain-containing protein n=1 Tax=uncultured Nocardioides sp. TaxID=198441 RepID=UPI002635842E|nr:LysM peptidoglycan-binding domain-containing protein [uncultured Nocardioides sp.]HRD60002.1 LysM peptidoglycan-binding domain-containing protein [Nocardioides sp.]HRI98606.1 LysM peptidoglycan-binding domain-containing protein [Nocardioides sp.]HRK48399.1 LysM peptidoglycan-binding domain-containing protein [Nocardioides sp.]